MKKIIALLLVCVLAFAMFAGCGKTEKTDTPDSEAVVNGPISGDGALVRFTMENGDTFTMQMHPEYAPKTVENFLKLVSEGFYNGLTFHRVVEGFMAQGGDPNGTGNGGSDETIYGEFASNGFTQNTLSHTRGVVSMARATPPDSASSQFFICYDDASFLDGNYAAFAVVVDGMETVDAFLEIPRVMGGDGAVSRPTTPIVIRTAEIVEA